MKWNNKLKVEPVFGKKKNSEQPGITVFENSQLLQMTHNVEINKYSQEKKVKFKILSKSMVKDEADSLTR